MYVKSDSIKEKKCRICDKMCILKGYASHMRSHLKLESHEYDKQYFSKNPLKRNRVVHNAPKICEKETKLVIDEDDQSNNVKEKECHICGKVCLLKGLTAHTRSHLKDNCFKCEECGSQFSTTKSLKQHMLIHNVCEICNKKFHNDSQLQHHTCITGKLKTHICETCGKGFSKPFFLKVHIRTHTKETPFSCDVCNKQFMHKENLKAHYRRHIEENMHGTHRSHDEKKYDNASKSNEKDITNSLEKVCNVNRHSIQKRGKKCVNCDICGKEYYNNYCLKRHMRIHSNEKPYICQICNKAFNQKGHLDSHYHIHNDQGRPDKNFVCEICFESFNSNANLKIHSLIHTQIKPFACNICNKSFRRNYHLTLHTRWHKGDKPFKCENCNKSFISKSALGEHEKKHKVPEHICSICNKAFFFAYQLNLHNQTHTKARPYICDICHKGVASMHSLKLHYLGHASLRVNKTKKCSNIVINDQKSNLRVSNTSSDEKEIKIMCKVCKIVFSNKKNLKYHANKFMKEGNYKCCKCLQVYTDKNQLLKHYNNHKSFLMLKTFSCSNDSTKFNDELYECLVCKKIFQDKVSLEFHSKTFCLKDCFKCCMCSEIFNDEEELLKHKRAHGIAVIETIYSSEHSQLNENPIFCRICKHIFPNIEMLEHHNNEFMQEENFKCCMCHHNYSVKDHLLNHYKMHDVSPVEVSSSSDKFLEIEEKPYICEVCLKIFQTLELLACHKEEYLQENNLKCCECQQVYSEKDILFEHHKVHKFTEKPYICFLKPTICS